MFHNFSVFSSINWAESLLSSVFRIDYVPPVRNVCWQYELRGCDLKTAKQLHATLRCGLRMRPVKAVKSLLFSKRKGEAANRQS